MTVNFLFTWFALVMEAVSFCGGTQQNIKPIARAEGNAQIKKAPEKQTLFDIKDRI